MTIHGPFPTIPDHNTVRPADNNYPLFLIHYPNAYIQHHPHHQPPAHRRRVHHSSHRSDRRQCADSSRHAGALRHGGEDTGGHQGRQEHKSAERQLLCGDRSKRLGQGSKKGKGNPRGVRGLPLKLTKASVETFQLNCRRATLYRKIQGKDTIL